MSAAICSRRRHSRGFTLLELMIAVVVVGILASLALPSYRSYLLRSHRAVVRTLLVDLAAKLEVEALRTGGYPDTFDFHLAEPAGRMRGEKRFLITSRSTVIAEAGDPGHDTAIYEISLITAPPPAGEPIRDYTLTARAVHGQRADSACLTLSLRASGLRGASPGRSEDCWGR